MLECKPKLVAIDEETNHQIVHGRRFGKADRAAHQTLNAGPQIDVLAFDLLCVLFAHDVLLGIDMSLVGTPPIRVKLCETTWLSMFLPLGKHGLFASRKEAVIMASATPAASWRGHNVQASDKDGLRRCWRLTAAAERGRCGDRSRKFAVVLETVS